MEPERAEVVSPGRGDGGGLDTVVPDGVDVIAVELAAAAVEVTVVFDAGATPTGSSIPPCVVVHCRTSSSVTRSTSSRDAS